jgi:hypothetical protein
MRKLGLSLSLTSAAMTVRSAFKIASVNPVLWWDAESHRAGLAGGAATLFQDSVGTSAVTAVEQPVGRVADVSGSGNAAMQATSTARPVLTARKNLLTYSEQFDNAAWTKDNSTVSVNSAIAPDGTTSADTITSNSASEAKVVQYKSVASYTTYTATVFVKKDSNESRFTEFYLRTEAGAYQEIYFQLNTKTGASVIRYQNGSASKNVESYGDYWRVSATLTNTTDSTMLFGIRPAATNSIGTYNPQVGSVTVYGAQVEIGAVATSYQRITTATDYDITAAPLMLQFDGVDDGLASAPFIAGSLPANADAYLVFHPDADEQEGVLVEDVSSSGTRYFGPRHPSQAIAQSADGSTTAGAAFTANGSLIAGTTNPTRAQLFAATQTGVPVLLQVTGLNLAAWTQIGLGRYVGSSSGFGYKGRHGCLLITPAQPDATRAKIRKALAKAYQITGVV